MSYEPLDERTLTREERARAIRVICADQLRPAHVQHYVDSTMTISEICDEVTTYLGHKDQRVGETRGRPR